MTATPGFVMVASAFPFAETLARLEAAIAAAGLTIFARVDHAAGASAVGMSLPPTMLLLFGAAKAGTPLMQANQAIGIDLPLKALVSADAAGKASIVYNDPHWLAARHGLGASATPITDAMAAGLTALAAKATAS